MAREAATTSCTNGSPRVSESPRDAEPVIAAETAMPGILEGQLVEHGGKRLPDGRSMTQVLRLEQFAVRGDEREFGRG